MHNSELLRSAFLSGVPNHSAQYGTELATPAHLYAPQRHAQALDPNTMIVEGIRGAGKSLWWAALLSKEHRKIIAKTLPKSGIDENVDVLAGFGTGLRASEAPTKDIISKLMETYEPRQIWRAVVGHRLLTGANSIPGSKWSERISWIQDNPEEFQSALDETDVELSDAKKTKLIIFDALDTAADTWDNLRNLLKGLLQTTLEFRSYKRMRLKVFLRPDMLQDQRIANFPDASKVLTSRAQLSWTRADLYGLLWQLLGNAPTGGHEFRSLTSDLAEPWREEDGVWNVPQTMRRDDNIQRTIFHELSGPWMGKNHKRGFPYTWLPNHLADSFDQASPRSFQVALREAAQHDPPSNWHYPLYHEGIRKGVQEASRVRVREITEDYLWVNPVMETVRGKLTVPCKITDIDAIWTTENTLKTLQGISHEGLGPQHLSEGSAGLIADLKDLGIFNILADGRLQMPDVYRVAFGVGRRGGVKPLR